MIIDMINDTWVSLILSEQRRQLLNPAAALALLLKWNGWGREPYVPLSRDGKKNVTFPPQYVWDNNHRTVF